MSWFESNSSIFLRLSNFFIGGFCWQINQAHRLDDRPGVTPKEVTIAHLTDIYCWIQRFWNAISQRDPFSLCNITTDIHTGDWSHMNVYIYIYGCVYTCVESSWLCWNGWHQVVDWAMQIWLWRLQKKADQWLSMWKHYIFGPCLNVWHESFHQFFLGFLSFLCTSYVPSSFNQKPSLKSKSCLAPWTIFQNDLLGLSRSKYRGWRKPSLPWWNCKKKGKSKRSLATKKTWEVLCVPQRFF